MHLAFLVEQKMWVAARCKVDWGSQVWCALLHVCNK